MAKNPYTQPNRDEAHDTERCTDANSKSDNLETYRSDATGHDLRTNQGTRIADNHNSLKAGERARR